MRFSAELSTGIILFHKLSKYECKHVLEVPIDLVLNN
jgi:hypothetical protein